MKAHEFTIIASGPDPESDDFEDRFFEAGCDDATIGFSRGVTVLEFAREADNLASAINSAIEDVGKAGALVERIEPDWLVSLSDIAERANLTRAAITNYAKGDRGRLSRFRSLGSPPRALSGTGPKSPDGCSGAGRCPNRSFRTLKPSGA